MTTEPDPTCSNWKDLKIGDILTLEYGKALQNYREGVGAYEVFGTNGKIGSSDKYLYDKPSLIIGRKGAYRGVHLAKAPFFVIDTAFYTKNNIKDLDIYFIYNWFKCVDINSMDNGSAIPSTSRDEIYDLDISLPPLPEQKAMASIFSSLNDKIDLLHRQNKTLEAMAETLFRQWFVEEARENWEEIPVTDLFEVRDGTHDSPKQAVIGKPLITSKHIFDGRIDFDNAYLISEDDFNKVNQRSKVDSMDILFSMIGTIGLIYLEQSNDINYSIKNIGLFKTSQNTGWAYYTYLWLKSPIGRQFIDEHRSGSTQEYVSLGSLRSITFKKPSTECLRKFNNLVSPHFNKIRNNFIEINTLEKLRNILLPKLVSGEVSVSR